MRTLYSSECQILDHIEDIIQKLGSTSQKDLDFLDILASQSGQQATIDLAVELYRFIVFGTSTPGDIQSEADALKILIKARGSLNQALAVTLRR